VIKSSVGYSTALADSIELEFDLTQRIWDRLLLPQAQHVLGALDAHFITSKVVSNGLRQVDLMDEVELSSQREYDAVLLDHDACLEESKREKKREIERAGV